MMHKIYRNGSSDYTKFEELKDGAIFTSDVEDCKDVYIKLDQNNYLIVDKDEVQLVNKESASREFLDYVYLSDETVSFFN